MLGDFSFPYLNELYSLNKRRSKLYQQFIPRVKFRAHSHSGDIHDTFKLHSDYIHDIFMGHTGKFSDIQDTFRGRKSDMHDILK